MSATGSLPSACRASPVAFGRLRSFRQPALPPDRVLTAAQATRQARPRRQRNERIRQDAAHIRVAPPESGIQEYIRQPTDCTYLPRSGSSPQPPSFQTDPRRSLPPGRLLDDLQNEFPVSGQPCLLIGHDCFHNLRRHWAAAGSPRHSAGKHGSKARTPSRAADEPAPCAESMAEP